MKLEEMEELFDSEEWENEYLCFTDEDLVGSNRVDLAGFLLIDKLAPMTSRGEDIIIGAKHDEIFIYPDMEVLLQNITAKDILTLIRLGFRWDSNYGGFSKFV